MNDEPPVRLLEDPAVDAQLRLDLRTSRAQPPLDYDVASGLAQLKARVSESASQASAGQASAGANGSPLTTSAGAGALKWWGVSLVGLAAVGVAWLALPGADWTSRSQSGGRPDAHVAPATADPTAIDAETASQQAPRKDVPAPEGKTPEPRAELAPPPRSEGEPRTSEPVSGDPVPPAVERPTRPARGERAATVRARATTTQRLERPPAVDPDGWKLREIRQLAEARRALENDPGLTLRVSRAGQREFQDGMFVQERSALIVFALDALGRTEQARKAAREHLRHHGDGPFAARVERILEAAP